MTEKNNEDKKGILKEFGLTNLAITNVKTVLLISVLIVIAGIGAYKSMPKEAFPELAIPQIYVGVAYPGAGPKVIEDRITRPLEKEIHTIKGIDKIKSTSIFGYSTILVEFKFDVTPEQGLRKVKDAVDKARGDKDFPKDLPAEPNIFEMNFAEFPIMNINLSGAQGTHYTTDDLNSYAEYLEDEIENIEEISKVEIRGVQKKELKIEVRKHDAEAMMVSFQDIENAIVAENFTMSAGEINDNGLSRTVKVEGEFNRKGDVKNIEEIKNLVVKRDHFEIVRLYQVADVYFGDEDTVSYARQNRNPVVMLDVIKRSGTNLLEASEKIFRTIREAYEKERIPSDVRYTITNDMSFKTKDQVSNLENNIISGVILVILILQLFIGLRSAIFVGMAIPLSMFISFVLLQAMGVTLNIMVLFSLVLALGMLVDNGIVVIENIYRQVDNGLPLFEAVKHGVGEIAWPIISSTATTVAAFIPLALWPGLMGEFMQYLPITLMIVLSSSLFVALVINPVLALIFMKADEKPVAKKVIKNALIAIAAGTVLILLDRFTLGNLIIVWALLSLLNLYVMVPGTKLFQGKLLPALENRYSNFLKVTLNKRPGRTLLATFGLLIISIIVLAVSQPKVLFFPANQPNYVNVFIEMPVGTDIKKTNEITMKAEYIIDTTLQKYKSIVTETEEDTFRLISSMIAQVGEGTSDPNQGPVMGNTPHKSRITVSFAEFPYRQGYSTSEIMKEIDQSLEGVFDADVQISVAKNEEGPPQQPPINIELYGDNYDSIIAEAEKMRVFLDTMDVAGVEELKLDVETGKPELPIYPNREMARRMDVSTSQIAMTLRTALFGKDISTYKVGEEEYDINLRYKEDLRNMNDLLNQKITFRDMLSGQLVQIPIRTVVDDPQRSSTYSAVKRKNLDRLVTVVSNVKEGYNPNEVVEELKGKLAGYTADNGVTYKFTGQMEDQAKEMAFLSNALIIAVFMVFLIIVAQFNSISSPGIIMISVLLSLIGVFLGLVIFQMEFVIIMTMIGIISLAGVVVNNAIVLVDFIILLIRRKREELNTPEDENLDMQNVIDCVVEAGRTRLRPVLLTALTTLLGLIPLAIGFNLNFFTLISDYDPQIFIGGDNVMFFGPLSWTVIFGLTFATFLTLVIVPVIFLLFHKMKLAIYRKTKWGILKTY